MTSGRRAKVEGPYVHVVFGQVFCCPTRGGSQHEHKVENSCAPAAPAPPQPLEEMVDVLAPTFPPTPPGRSDSEVNSPTPAYRKV